MIDLHLCVDPQPSQGGEEYDGRVRLKHVPPEQVGILSGRVRSIVKLTCARFWFLQRLWVMKLLRESFFNWLHQVEVQNHWLLFLHVSKDFHWDALQCPCSLLTLPLIDSPLYNEASRVEEGSMSHVRCLLTALESTQSSSS